MEKSQENLQVVVVCSFVCVLLSLVRGENLSLFRNCYIYNCYLKFSETKHNIKLRISVALAKGKEVLQKFAL